jgi:hypothetical protein
MSPEFMAATGEQPTELTVLVKTPRSAEWRTVRTDDAVNCLTESPTTSMFLIDGVTPVHGAFSFGFLGLTEGVTISVVEPPTREDPAPRRHPAISERARLWDVARARAENGKRSPRKMMRRARNPLNQTRAERPGQSEIEIGSPEFWETFKAVLRAVLPSN